MRTDALISAVRSYLRAAEYVQECRHEATDDIARGEELDRARRKVEAQLGQLEAAVPAPGAIRKVMVAVKDVEHDGAVAHFAGRLARDLSATLILLHVHDPTAGMSAEAGYASAADFEHARFQSRELLTTIQTMLPEGVSSEAMLREGGAAREIVSAAKELRVDMLVVGTHGPGRLEQLFIGSTAAAVTREAHCPVVVVNRRAKKTLVEAEHAEPAYVSS